MLMIKIFLVKKKIWANETREIWTKTSEFLTF